MLEHPKKVTAHSKNYKTKNMITTFIFSVANIKE